MITNPKTFFEQFQNFIEESGLQLKKFKSNLSNYFTKAEAIDTFLGKTDKAESAKTADSVSWEGVTGKPVLADVNTRLDKLEAPTAVASNLAAGEAPTVSVSQQPDGKLQWSFGIPKGEKGDTGPQGIQGVTGAAGTAATIKIGTVTTGAAGTSAKVVNSGTTSAAVLDFTIPQGAKGDKGDTGNAATIEVGTVTTGAAGSSASVVNRGDANNAILDFILPKGDDGKGSVITVNGKEPDAGGNVDLGIIPIANGGTGATNAASALQNLGITYSTTDLTAGTSALETGTIYLVYE